VQEQVLRFASISLLEKQDWLSIPFQSNLYFGHRNCRPYFCVGGSIGFLLKASLVIEREDQAEAFSFSVAEDKVNVTEMRTNILFQPSLGIGIQFLNSKKRSNSYAELRFQYSSTNRTRPSNRYTNDELIYRFLYIDDDFKMSSIEVSIGYLIPYFKPVLKRSFRKG